MKNLITSIILASSFLVGSAIAEDKPKAPAKGEPAKEDKKAPAKAEPIDLNSATEAQLKDLAGVGEAGAKKIVAARPFAKAEDLVSKKILDKAAFEKIKAQVTVKPVEAKKDDKTKK